MFYTIFLVVLLTPGILLVPIKDDEALQEFIDGNHKFSSAAYKHLANEKTGNIIVSPFSVETVMALAYEGAKGQTASELFDGLSLPDTDEKLHSAFKSLTPQFQISEDDFKLLSANKIFVAADVKLDESFEEAAVNFYSSGVENVDFSESGTVEKINEWVEDNTNQKIQNLIDPSSVGVDTRIVLVNTLYFYGKWVSMFEEKGTVKKTFFKNKNETVEVNTMTQTGSLNYCESSDLAARFLELPYQDGDMSMVIALPNDVEGLSALEANIEEVLKDKQFWSEYLEVNMPKFVIESEINFAPILKSLGIQRVFDGNGDLTGFSSEAQNLYISEVTQKAYINVTEAGTEAAGGSGGIAPNPMPGPPGPDPVQFHIDHPFLYVIKKSGVISFIGRYTG